MNRLHIVANPRIIDANPTDYRWQQIHGFSQKKKKTKQNKTKTQYTHSINQVKQKLKSET